MANLYNPGSETAFSPVGDQQTGERKELDLICNESFGESVQNERGDKHKNDNNVDCDGYYNSNNYYSVDGDNNYHSGNYDKGSYCNDDNSHNNHDGRCHDDNGFNFEKDTVNKNNIDFPNEFKSSAFDNVVNYIERGICDGDFEESGRHCTNSIDTAPASSPGSHNSAIRNSASESDKESVTKMSADPENTPRAYDPKRLAKINKMMQEALKDHYMSKKITKEEYKIIMKKAVMKIFTSGERRLESKTVKKFADDYMALTLARKRHLINDPSQKDKVTIKKRGEIKLKKACTQTSQVAIESVESGNRTLEQMVADDCMVTNAEKSPSHTDSIAIQKENEVKPIDKSPEPSSSHVETPNDLGVDNPVEKKESKPRRKKAKSKNDLEPKKKNGVVKANKKEVEKTSQMKLKDIAKRLKQMR